MLKRIFDFGKIDINGTGRKINKVEVAIKLTDDNVFTCRGIVWNSRHTDGIRGGQCLDDLAPFFKSNSLFNTIYNWWKNYHLNDMHAGTPKQEEALKGKHLGYKAEREYLESIGLLYDNGYEYGSSWLKEEIPADVLNSMRELLKEVK